MSGNPHLHHVYAKIFNAFSVAKRTFELQAYYERMYGIMRAKNGHPEIVFRHVIGPLREMPSKIVPIDYRPEEVKKQIEVGQKDAEVFIEHDKQKIEKMKHHPKVKATEKDGSAEKEQLPEITEKERKNYPCFPKRRYNNPERQAKLERICGKDTRIY